MHRPRPRASYASRARCLAGLLALVGACSEDPCVQLCRRTTSNLAACLEDWPADWVDVGADDRTEFRDSCTNQWAEARSNLEPRELDDALNQCDESLDAIQASRDQGTICDELRALYL